MGIRLVMEASTRAPDSLTWRERYALMVLAASAIDVTRECPAGIEDNPEIIDRLRLGRSERYAVIKSLVDKGALMRLERGRNGVQAVYAIAPFVTIPGLSERPGEPDARPVDNHPVNNGEGSGIPGGFSPVKGPGSADEGSGKPGLKGPGTTDPAPYKGSYGFKTGGGKPPCPPPGSRPLFPFVLPEAPPEGGIPRAKRPATNDPMRVLAAEIRELRPAWSVRSIIRAVERSLADGRPWPVAAEAMRIVAADPASQHPGRVNADGPWWPQAERNAGMKPGDRRPPWCGHCDQRTRHLDPDADNPVPCPRCHPSSVKARPA